MTLNDAMVQAQALSADNSCGQHVNRRLDGTYYTSDWYNSDSTVITYDRGKIAFWYEGICDGIGNRYCNLTYNHDAHLTPAIAPLVLDSKGDRVEIAMRLTLASDGQVLAIE